MASPHVEIIVVFPAFFDNIIAQFFLYFLALALVKTRDAIPPLFCRDSLATRNIGVQEIFMRVVNRKTSDISVRTEKLS